MTESERQEIQLEVRAEMEKMVPIVRGTVREKIQPDWKQSNCIELKDLDLSPTEFCKIFNGAEQEHCREYTNVRVGMSDCNSRIVLYGDRTEWDSEMEEREIVRINKVTDMVVLRRELASDMISATEDK